MKGFERGIRLAIAVSAIALLAVALPGSAVAGTDEDTRDNGKQTVSEKRELNRKLHGRDGGSAGKRLETRAKDEAGTLSSTHEGSSERSIAERRGRLDRRDSTETVGLELGGSEEGQASGVAVTLICHKPETRAEKTLLLPLEAVPGHLGHGDFEGSCDGNETEVAP